MVATIPGSGAQATVSADGPGRVRVLPDLSWTPRPVWLATCSRNSGSSPARPIKDATGFKAVLCNPFVATAITVVLGVGLA